MKTDLEFLRDFINENKASGQLSLETSEQIKTLWDRYKVNEVKKGTTVICGEFGLLGSLILREVVKSNNKEKTILKYQSGSYDFIDINYKGTTILWTDYQNIEPYNRQSGLYASGSTFKWLGEPIKQLPEYREFVKEHGSISQLCYGVWGFDYNNYYGSVTFGICLKNKDVKEFVTQLRAIINKPE